MPEYNSSDIPATIKLKEGLKPLQEEYRTALMSGQHPEKELINSFYIGAMSFNQKCQHIYEVKLSKLCWDIIEEHNKTYLNHIDLLEYKRFKDLVWDAIFKTRDFLETL
jgi:hypothetical protein